MISAMNQILVAAGASLAASLAESMPAAIVAKATVIAALALSAAWLARRNRAAVRHALLAASFAALLALPLASILAPPIRIAVVQPEPRRAAHTVGSAAIPPAAARAAAPEDAGNGASWLQRLTLSNLLLAAWIAGAALFLVPVAVGLWQVRSLRRTALPWPEGQSAVDALASAAGIHRRVEALLHDALPGPMTCGVGRAAILLPLEARNWQAADLDRAIVHELEHVRRADWAIHCLARSVCAAYWFHPLVWMAWRKLQLEAERSCDDAVLARSEATVYADQLVGLARRLSAPASAATAKPPLLAMANRADLTARVGALLDSKQRRGRAGVAIVSLACVAAAALVLTISPLRMVAAPQSDAAGLIPMVQIATNTNLVVEAVKVTDRNGRVIEGIKASDFTVTEDGVPQVISVFEFQKLDDPRDPNLGSSYYVLGYYASNPSVEGKLRQIKIALPNHPAATLDYRPRYYESKSFMRFASPSDGSGKKTAGTQAVRGIAVGPFPLLLRKQDPEYSEEARKAKFQGTVVLNIEVDASGNVANVAVARTLGLGLDEKAVEAVKQWQFKPAMKDGTAIPVQVQVAMSFRLL